MLHQRAADADLFIVNKQAIGLRARDTSSTFFLRRITPLFKRGVRSKENANTVFLENKPSGTFFVQRGTNMCLFIAVYPYSLIYKKQKSGRNFPIFLERLGAKIYAFSFPADALCDA